MLQTFICRQGAKMDDIPIRRLRTSEHGSYLKYPNVTTMKSIAMPGYIQRAGVEGMEAPPSSLAS